jgi:hypothetical protein
MNYVLLLIFLILFNCRVSYGLDDPGFESQLWGPPPVLFSRYQGPVPGA